MKNNVTYSWMARALLSPFVIGWLPVETSLERVKAIDNMKSMGGKQGTSRDLTS